MQLLSNKELYFEILIAWSIDEPISQSEPFHEDLCMSDIIVV